MGTSKAHFGHTKITVDDLERCAGFYAEVCGLVEFGRVEATMNGRAATEVMFAPTGDGGPMLVLVKWHEVPAAPNNGVLLGFTTPDLEALCARVTAAGGHITQEITLVPAHGVKAAFATDIEGNVLEMLQLL